MATNNVMQQLRSPTAAAPGSLLAGQLAYSNAVGGSGVLYIGSTDGATVVPIAGLRTPGVLTANQALVANTTSGLNNVITANLTIQGNSSVSGLLIANASPGTAGWVLFSGGSTSNLYWASAGSLSVNTAAAYTWTNVHTFQGNSTATSFLTVGANLTMNSVNISWIGNTTTSPTVSIANSGVIQTGNSTITGAPQLIVANTLGTATINTNAMTVTNTTGITTQTPTSITVNANAVSNVIVGNSSIYSYVNSSAANVSTLFATTANVSTVYATGLVNAANFVTTGTVNTATVFATGQVNAAYFTTTGTVNTATVYATGAVNAASYQAGANGTGTGGFSGGANYVFLGNNTINTNITTTSLAISNSTGTSTITPTSANIGSTILTVNSTVMSFSGGNIAATSANLSILNMSVTGNLTVAGTVTAINTSQLIVNDNIIELGDGNITTDTVDTGFFSPGGNATNIWYSGLVRQAAASKNNAPVFWLFGSNTNPNTATTIDTSSNSVTATLIAYISTGNSTVGSLFGNSSVLNITANSTVSVNITANNLLLTTVDGGTF